VADYKVLTPSDLSRAAVSRDAFALDVLLGLSAHRKSIPSKYFYDDRGSELFKRITDLEEYYPTASEFEILERHGARIADRGSWRWFRERTAISRVLERWPTSRSRHAI